MAGAVITKAINDLKANADKLNPKPSPDFDKYYKAYSPDVIDAAKSIDASIFRKNAGAAQAALKSFDTDASKFFTNLGNVANKEAPAIKGKLTGIISAAKKKTTDATKSEVDAFLKDMANQARSADQAKDALEKHTATSQRGANEAAHLLQEAKEALNKVTANRKKGGEDALEESQKLLHHLRVSETALSQKGAFHDSQKGLATQHSKTLDSDSQSKAEVARMRKAAEMAQASGQRLLDECRALRQKVYIQVIEHQDEEERAKALAAKNDRSQTGQSKKLETEFNKFHADARDVLDRADKSSWKKLKELNEPGKEKEYQSLLKETQEAFKQLQPLPNSLRKNREAVEELQKEVAKEDDTSKELKDSVAKLLTKFSNLKRTLDAAVNNQGTFENLVAECDQARKKRGAAA